MAAIPRPISHVELRTTVWVFRGFLQFNVSSLMVNIGL